MKKKQKIILISVVSLIVLASLGAGGFYYFNKRKVEKKAEQQKVETNTPSSVSTEKTDNSPQVVTPIQLNPSTTTTTAPQTLPVLADVSVTVYPYNTDSIAPDGKTTMPAGSLAPSFYPQSGSFTIQKMVSGAWKDIITNQAYPGHGGISAWFAGPTEDNIQYRVLLIEGGKPVSASKTFVVKRSDLTGGPYTYN